MKHQAEEVLAALPAAVSTRLSRYAELLLRWNARINLVAPGDLEHIWRRHILDSLQLAPLLPAAAARIVDFGSGAGFPGLILAICTEHPVTLIESDTRKVSFLREAARQTETRATILNTRIEQADVAADVVTARALAPLEQLLDWAAPCLEPNGFCLFLKGRRVAKELTVARAKWHMTIAQTPSQTSPDGVILTLSGIRRLGAGAPYA